MKLQKQIQKVNHQHQFNQIVKKKRRKKREKKEKLKQT